MCTNRKILALSLTMSVIEFLMSGWAIAIFFIVRKIDHPVTDDEGYRKSTWTLICGVPQFLFGIFYVWRAWSDSKKCTWPSGVCSVVAVFIVNGSIFFLALSTLVIFVIADDYPCQVIFIIYAVFSMLVSIVGLVQPCLEYKDKDCGRQDHLPKHSKHETFKAKVKNFYWQLSDMDICKNYDNFKQQLSQINSSQQMLVGLDLSKKEFPFDTKIAMDERELVRLLLPTFFNPDYGLFREVRQGCGRYTIDEKSELIDKNYLHLFNFCGKLLAQAIFENIPVEHHLARYLLLCLSGKALRAANLRADDPKLFADLERLKYLNSEELAALNLKFSYEIETFGEVKNVANLAPFDCSTIVTTSDVHQYVNSYCLFRMTGAVEKQIHALAGGFYEIIPQSMIATFSPSELDLLLCGEDNIDISKMKEHVVYLNCCDSTQQVKWLWQVVESFSAEQCAKFVKFVTGSDRVPLGGFDRRHGGKEVTIALSTTIGSSQLPLSHNGTNRLELAKYESFEILKQCLLKAIDGDTLTKCDA